jgi:hypothetical protein
VRRLGQKAGPVARWSELLRHCNAMLTAGLSSGQLPLLAGISSGSGSARLGLSQKGDLPSSGERRAFWSKVADARAKPR